LQPMRGDFLRKFRGIAETYPFLPFIEEVTT
jgi:hypothetical protein